MSINSWGPIHSLDCAGNYTLINCRAAFHQRLDILQISNTCTRLSPKPLVGSNKRDPRDVASTLTVKATNSISLHLSINSWGSIHSLRRSELYANQLMGTIPATIGTLTNLQYVYEMSLLFQYCTRTLANCKYFKRLLNDNQLISPLPTFLQTMPAFSVHLENNHFVRKPHT